MLDTATSAPAVRQLTRLVLPAAAAVSAATAARGAETLDFIQLPAIGLTW
jgi:hypothetical protein